jgi:hypothetical protein
MNENKSINHGQHGIISKLNVAIITRTQVTLSQIHKTIKHILRLATDITGFLTVKICTPLTVTCLGEGH